MFNDNVFALNHSDNAAISWFSTCCRPLVHYDE